MYQIILDLELVKTLVSPYNVLKTTYIYYFMSFAFF